MTIKKNINHFKFTRETNSPCFCDKTKPYDSDANRLVPRDELNTYGMIEAYFDGKLNQSGIDFMKDYFSKTFMSEKPERIHRVSRDDPFYGKKFYLVRYCGKHGPRVRSVFISCHEDNNPSSLQIHPGIIDGTCKTCGYLGYCFRLSESSKIVRCGGCFRLEGVRGPL